MKFKHLYSLLNFIITFEILLSPLTSLANNEARPNILESIYNSTQTAGQIYNNVRGPVLPQHVQADMAGLQQQQTPVPDRLFSWKTLGKIPGLAEYMALSGVNPQQLECRTLPASMYEAKNNVCVSKVATNPAEAQEAFAYYNQYTQINKLYRNYSTISSVEGQQFGVGCMDRAMELLNGFFSYRLEQLDLVSAKLDEEVQRFENDPRAIATLNTIKESSALLNGPGSTFGQEIKDPEFFNYAKRLGGDNACSSVMPADDMNKKTGLRAIDQEIKSELNTKVGNLSLANYTQKHADIEKDIQNLAKNASEHVKNNFENFAGDSQEFSKTLSTLGNDVGSIQGVHSALNPAFFADLNSKYQKTYQDLNRDRSLISQELKNSRSLNLLAQPDDAIFTNQVMAEENQFKSSCLTGNESFKNALLKIEDLTVTSKNAQRASTKLLRKQLEDILSNPQLSPERKLQELNLLDSKSSGRYRIRLAGDYVTEEIVNGQLMRKTVAASNIVTPKSFFSDLIKNCESRFELNRANNQLSGREAFTRLRNLRNEYQKLKRQKQVDISNQIINRMINCAGDVTAQNSSADGSCSSDALIIGPTFCSKRAFSCSTNIQKCNQKTNELIQKTSQARINATASYNQRVDQLSLKMDAIFTNALNKYTQEAEQLRALFGAGNFALPERVLPPQADDQFNSQFLSTSDPDRIKDPKKFLKAMRENMKNLRSTIEEQQKQILGGGVENPSGLLAKHKEDTLKRYQEMVSPSEEFAQRCLEAYNNFNKSINEANQQLAKDQSEFLGEKAELCGLYDEITSLGPSVACDEAGGKIGTTATAAISAAQKIGDQRSAVQAQNLRNALLHYCKEFMNSDSVTWANVCAEKGATLGYKELCAKVNDCRVEKTEETVIDNCSTTQDQIVAKYMLERQKNPSRAISNDATAFCRSSENSGRGNSAEELLESILKETTRTNRGTGT
jgi:hypothetical protein